MPPSADDRAAAVAPERAESDRRRQPGIVNLISATEMEHFLGNGLVGRLGLPDKVRRFLRIYAGQALEECGQRRAAIRTIRKVLKRLKISSAFLTTGGAKAAIFVNKGHAAGMLRGRQC